MRAPRLALLALLLVFPACGPSVEGGGDDDGGDDDPSTCSGDEQRCVGNQLQGCSADGAWEVLETCATACNADLGCVDCDPAGGNACNGNDVVSCNSDGSFGGVIETCSGGESCVGGECSTECTADGVDLIYVVDQDYRLLSYDPRKVGTAEDPFTLIGNLDCPASSTPVPGWVGGVTPFSMSVDRNGTAWVLYTSGEIFHVDIRDASCAATSFQPSQSANGTWHLFGMGFVTDEAGGTTERLWIGGGNADAQATPRLFGYIDPGTMQITGVGQIGATSEYAPEFTGTGNAELFAFFPGTSNAFVQGVDKSNGGAVGNQMSVGALTGGVSAWAFAHWGGSFYVFVTTGDGLFTPFNSQVRRVSAAGGAPETLAENLDYVIVGAGVSTCAPTDVD